MKIDEFAEKNKTKTSKRSMVNRSLDLHRLN
jgi:hypothetical protein